MSGTKYFPRISSLTSWKKIIFLIAWIIFWFFTFSYYLHILEMLTTITGSGLQSFDLYSAHTAIEQCHGSLTYHTYRETGKPFIMVISEDQWHSHLLPCVWQWSCHYLLGLSRPEIEPRSPEWDANVLPLRHLGVHKRF